MGHDLIYRCDCNLFSELSDVEGMIRDLMAEYNLNWDECDEDKVFEFGMELMQKAQNYIDSTPTLTTDEYVAFKCPECHNVYIEENDPLNSYCPICGTRRKYA